MLYFSLLDDEDSIPGDDPDESGNVPFLNVKHAGQTWELVKYTVEGLPANCNSGDSYKEIAYLAVQRRRKSRRLDHICEVLIVYIIIHFFNLRKHMSFNITCPYRLLFYKKGIRFQMVMRW